MGSKQKNKEEQIYPVFTDKATEKLKEILEKDNKVDHMLRIQVIPGGCAGFRYDFSFDKKQSDKDILIQKNNLKILIDKDSLKSMKSARVDFIDSLQGSGFKIDNPNAKSSCGCGKSFC